MAFYLYARPPAVLASRLCWTFHTSQGSKNKVTSNVLDSGCCLSSSAGRQRRRTLIASEVGEWIWNLRMRHSLWDHFDLQNHFLHKSNVFHHEETVRLISLHLSRAVHRGSISGYDFFMSLQRSRGASLHWPPGGTSSNPIFILLFYWTFSTVSETGRQLIWDTVSFVVRLVFLCHFALSHSLGRKCRLRGVITGPAWFSWFSWPRSFSDKIRRRGDRLAGSSGSDVCRGSGSSGSTRTL